MTHPSTSLLRTRVAVALLFAINGFVYANWTSRLPRLQEVYGMDNGQTGFVLTALALGALVAMPLAGYLIVRNGSRKLAVWFTISFVLSVPIIAFLPGYWALILVMPIVGFSTGVMDVAMNAQAVDVEKLWGKPITSSFHACFSGGMFLGAGCSAGFIALGLDLREHMIVLTVISLGFSLYGIRHLLVDQAVEGEGEAAPASNFGSAIIILGVAALCCMLGEGAMADWTPLYMTRITGSSEMLAPIGQAAFSGAMFLGRGLGDIARHRLGSIEVVRGGALLALVGICLAVFIPTVTVAIIGFGLVGLGLSNIIPVVFSAASRVPGLSPGVGISSVSTIGYAAFLFGPPLIGFVSDYQNSLLPEGIAFLPGIAGLRVGLGLVIVLMGILLGVAVLYLKVED